MAQLCDLYSFVQLASLSPSLQQEHFSYSADEYRMYRVLSLYCWRVSRKTSKTTLIFMLRILASLFVSFVLCPIGANLFPKSHKHCLLTPYLHYRSYHIRCLIAYIMCIARTFFSLARFPGFTVHSRRYWLCVNKRPNKRFIPQTRLLWSVSGLVPQVICNKNAKCNKNANLPK